MIFEQISGKNSVSIKLAKKLISSSKERKKLGLFVLEGLRLCIDAKNSGVIPDTLFYTKTAFKKSENEINQLAKSCTKCYLVDNDVFASVSDTVSPQGILCIMKMPQKDTLTLKKNGKYIVLHNLSNPDNVGAVSRSAESFGLDGMIVTGGCDIYNPKALRASMGALLRLDVFAFSDDELFAEAAKYNIKTLASTPRKTAVPLNKCNFSGGCAVLIGNEANGLPEEIINRCESTVTIVMKGRAESLNAAAAAAVLCYEMTK